MISLAFIVLFFTCLGLAVMAALVGYQFIQTYDSRFHKSYFYYLISFYAFALYGFWGQLLVRTMLEKLDTTVKVVETIANFLPVLGIPFLFISWVMLINMAYGFFEKSVPKPWNYFHIFLFIVLTIIFWSTMQFESVTILAGQEKYIGIGLISILEILYHGIFMVVVLLGAKSKNARKQLLTFAGILFIFMLIRTILLPFAYENYYFLAMALLVYFASNIAPLVYLRVNLDKLFSPIKAANASDDKIELIYRKYKITRREKEIVHQICLGKTNQQIADELFISLQTVKDHTHRIYSKIGIKSRMQLVQMMN